MRNHNSQNYILLTWGDTMFIKSTSVTQLNVLMNIFLYMLYIYLFIVNVPEIYNLLQQMYLTRYKLNQLFTSNINKEQQYTRLTLKALLEKTLSPK